MNRLAKVVALAFALVLGAEGVAHADPQLGSALTSGVALTDFRAKNGPRVATHLGGRFDVLLLRERAGTMAFGPYVDVATAAFDTFETGGGLEWLVPAGDTAFILSGGAFARTSRFGWEPGLASTLFWGSRSYNYQSLYSPGVGLFAQGRYGLGDGKQADVIFGLQVDLEYLALPGIFLYQALTR
jgi:hypothetical protein